VTLNVVQIEERLILNALHLYAGVIRRAHVYVSVCECDGDGECDGVCVCGKERERQKDQKKQSPGERERKRERERERERDVGHRDMVINDDEIKHVPAHQQVGGASVY
jgi:hypothetical protein